MAKLLKLRRGTTSQHSSFTGAEGEVTIDTNKDVPVVHDGSTAGGHPVAAEDMSNVSSASITGRLGTGSIATAKIADQAVTLAKLEHGTSSNNGKFLRANNGADPTFETVNTDLVGDTTPQLGGNLDLNSNTINGTGNIGITGNISGDAVTVNNNNLIINGTTPNVSFVDSNGNPDYKLEVNGGVFAIHDTTNGANRIVVNSDGHIDVNGNLDVSSGVDVTGDITVTGTVDGADVGAMNTTLATLSSVNGSLASSVTATTAAAGNNSTLVATTAFVQTAVAGIVDSAPAALDTLNELAAALGDDANFATTTTNSIGTKFSKAGGDTITGDFTIASGTTNKNINVDVSDKIRFDDNLKATFGNSDDLEIFHDGNNSVIRENGTGDLYIQNGSSNVLRVQSSGVTVTGTATATTFSGSGASLTNIPAANITGTLPAIDGSNLTGIQGIPSGMIMIWSGAANAIPSGFVLCNGSNSTPDLRDRFVVGAQNAYSVGATGGADSVTLTVSQIPSHNHSVTFPITAPQGGIPSNNSFGCNHNSSGMTRTSSSVGGGGSHENRPPYYALCYVMKT